MPLRIPAHAFKRLVGARDRQIRNAQNMNARRTRRLGQEHGTKLASANESNANGIAGLGAFLELSEKIHSASEKAGGHVNVLETKPLIKRLHACRVYSTFPSVSAS